MSRVLLQQAFHTRLDAIKELHDWYVCPECGILCQPYSLREQGPPLRSKFTRTYTLGCGHRFEALPRRSRVFKVIEGGHNAEAFVTFETREKDGHQSEQLTQWGRSFLTNYYLCYMAIMGNAFNGVTIQQTVTDTGGTGRAFPGTVQGTGTQLVLESLAAAGANTYGMQVGTGSAANTIATVALGSIIPQGTAAGDLQYGSMGVTIPSGASPCNYTWTRTLTNGTANPITIYEVGLAGSGTYATNSTGYWLLIRDYNALGLATVNSGANTTGTYTLQYTIS